MNKPDATATERKRRQREREAEAGLTEVRFKVYAKDAAAFRAAVAAKLKKYLP